MSKGTYNFTDGHNKDVKDKSPDWMNSLFEKTIEKKEATIIKNLYSDTNNKIKKCSVCGKILAYNEIGNCAACKKL